MLQNLQKQIDNIINKDNHNDIKKRCIVQGKAGSGKTTVIHEMVRRIVRNFVDESVRIAAYIGAASQNYNKYNDNNLKVKNNGKKLTFGG